jgi:glucokinase
MTETEMALIAEHGDPNGHCSAETLLSGPGLVRIHATVARLAGHEEIVMTPATITAGALAGDELATRTYAVFFALLGTVAGNLALTVGARGGVFIGGGIVPRVIEAFARSDFRERFIAKGRYREYLDAIPTAVITAELPAFIGLKALLGYC